MKLCSDGRDCYGFCESDGYCPGDVGMSDHLKMPVHEQWTCGHVATAMCAECHQELARKANELVAETERLTGQLSFRTQVSDKLAADNEHLRALATDLRAYLMGGPWHRDHSPDEAIRRALEGVKG